LSLRSRPRRQYGRRADNPFSRLREKVAAKPPDEGEPQR